MDRKSMEEILGRIEELQFSSNFDLIVGIGNGGIVPAYLMHSYLRLPLEFIWINFRDEKHKPRAPKPILTKPLNFDAKNKNILLVDDRSNSGATIALAKKVLNDAKRISTFVVNGKADYFLFNEKCFTMPWDCARQPTNE